MTLGKCVQLAGWDLRRMGLRGAHLRSTKAGAAFPVQGFYPFLPVLPSLILYLP